MKRNGNNLVEVGRACARLQAFSDAPVQAVCQDSFGEMGIDCRIAHVLEHLLRHLQPVRLSSVHVPLQARHAPACTASFNNNAEAPLLSPRSHPVPTIQGKGEESLAGYKVDINTQETNVVACCRATNEPFCALSHFSCLSGDAASEGHIASSITRGACENFTETDLRGDEWRLRAPRRSGEGQG